jgi:hypothetical protein
MTPSRSQIATLIGVVALIVGWFWLGPRRPAPYVYRCRQYYDSAKNAADSGRVDRTISEQPDNPDSEPATCGELRALYPRVFHSKGR